MGYTNSPLVTYTRISNHRNSPRNHKIDTFTIHCFVGQVTAQSGCNCKNFTGVKGGSCNYVLGYEGSVGLCVEEKDRSWCSDSRENDNRAITIECASDTKAPYAVTQECYNKLLDLLTDCCQRNGIKKLIWFGDKNKTLSYQRQEGEACLTVHRWFATKSCPGDYLYNLHGQIADEVTRRLGGEIVEEKPVENTVPKQEGYLTYTIKRGDTLSVIAKKYNVTLDALLSVNPQITNSNKIYVGQVINLPYKTVKEQPVYHIVQKGETLSGIAKKYGTTYQKIAKLNGLANPNKISVGQKLRVK